METPKPIISTISVKGFSAIFMTFLLLVSFAMLITMALPNEYSTGRIANTCAFNNKTSCLNKLVENGSNFTVTVNDISATNQKVYIYLTYNVTTKPRGRVRMAVNSAMYKPKEGTKAKDITKYDQVKLIRHQNKRHFAYCGTMSQNKCSMLLETVESSKQYEDVFVVFNVTDAHISSGIAAPSLSIVYVNTSYTLFEVFWRIALLVIMSLCTLFYLYVMRGTPFKKWSIEQQCTVILMIGVTIANNGWYSYEFISANEMFPTINAICDALMLCGLLLYILIVMDALRKPLSQRTLWAFYVPRFVLTILMCIFIIALYLYNTENSDPIMVMMRDPINIVLVVLTLLFSLAYFFWLLFALIRSFSEARKLGEVGQRIKLYGTFTLIAIGILFVLLLAHYFTGYKSNQALYLTLIAYINIYAIVLMVFYFPSSFKGHKEWNDKRKEIVLDEMRITEYDDEDNEFVIEEEAALQETVVIDTLNEEL